MDLKFLAGYLVCNRYPATVVAVLSNRTFWTLHTHSMEVSSFVAPLCSRGLSGSTGFSSIQALKPGQLASRRTILKTSKRSKAPSPPNYTSRPLSGSLPLSGKSKNVLHNNQAPLTIISIFRNHRCQNALVRSAHWVHGGWAEIHSCLVDSGADLTASAQCIQRRPACPWV